MVFVNTASLSSYKATGSSIKAFLAHGYEKHIFSQSTHAVRLYDLEYGWLIAITHMHGLRGLAGKYNTADCLK